MGILQIKNRSENWKTARFFSPLLEDPNLPLRLANRLAGETFGIGKDEVRLELYWKGVRDYLHQSGGRNDSDDRCFAKHYKRLFPNLRTKVQEHEKFHDLKDRNYNLHNEDSACLLGNNLNNTEIDIVLETPSHLFIGEAKGEMSFGTDGNLFLVHQLIRQYVMASILVAHLGCEKRVVPFVVGNDVEAMRKTCQVKFMISQCYMREENVLTWDDIRKLSNP